jgi:hypothetical protein
MEWLAIDHDRGDHFGNLCLVSPPRSAKHGPPDIYACSLEHCRYCHCASSAISRPDSCGHPGRASRGASDLLWSVLIASFANDSFDSFRHLSGCGSHGSCGYKIEAWRKSCRTIERYSTRRVRNVRVVRPAGFEPAAYSSGGCRSIHLSNGRAEGVRIVRSISM